MVDEEARRLDPRGDLGQLVRDGLKLGQGPAERFDRIGMRRALDLLLPRADELSRNLGAPTGPVIPFPDPFA